MIIPNDKVIETVNLLKFFNFKLPLTYFKHESTIHDEVSILLAHLLKLLIKNISVITAGKNNLRFFKYCKIKQDVSTKVGYKIIMLDEIIKE